MIIGSSLQVYFNNWNWTNIPTISFPLSAYKSILILIIGKSAKSQKSTMVKNYISGKKAKLMLKFSSWTRLKLYVYTIGTRRFSFFVSFKRKYKLNCSIIQMKDRPLIFQKTFLILWLDFTAYHFYSLTAQFWAMTSQIKMVQKYYRWQTVAVC